MTNLFTKLYANLYAKLASEDGIETIEWIGLAAVVLVLLGAIGGVFGDDSSVGQAITNTMTSWINSLAGGG